MAKTTKEETKTMSEETTTTGAANDFSFNLENDFKQDPLIPNGNYFGNVIDVTFDAEKANIAWKVALDGNGGYLSDGETPVDGIHVFYRNYLPKKGDENIQNSNGKGNKFQTKVNMLKTFADGMKVNMNSMDVIQEAIVNSEFVGKTVLVTVKIQEYPQGSGQFNNSCDKMVAAE